MESYAILPKASVSVLKISPAWRIVALGVISTPLSNDPHIAAETDHAAHVPMEWPVTAIFVSSTNACPASHVYAKDPPIDESLI